MRNTAIVILLAIFMIAVIYTMTNTAPAPPPLPPPLPLTYASVAPITLPPSVLDNLTNASLHFD